MIIRWNQIYSYGTEINDKTILKTLLCASDQVLSSDSEYDLQRASHILHNTTEQFGLKISSLKSEILTFERQVVMIRKTVTDILHWNKQILPHIWDVKYHTERRRAYLRKEVNFYEVWKS
jgi:hypothetical protein